MLGNTSAQKLWWPRRGCLTHQGCYLYSPDGLIQRMEEFKAEAILFGGSLDQLTRMEEDCPNPLSDLWRLVNEQHSWFQDTPQSGPALQSPTNLEEQKKFHLHWSLEEIQHLFSIYTVFPVCLFQGCTTMHFLKKIHGVPWTVLGTSQQNPRTWKSGYQNLVFMFLLLA